MKDFFSKGSRLQMKLNRFAIQDASNQDIQKTMIPVVEFVIKENDKQVDSLPPTHQHYADMWTSHLKPKFLRVASRKKRSELTSDERQEVIDVYHLIANSQHMSARQMKKQFS